MTATKEPVVDSATRLKELKAQLAAAKKARDEEMGKDWEQYAQGIVTKLFSEFKPLKRYLDKVEEQSKTRGFVMSEVGRRRVLFRVMTGIPKYIGDAGRRAKNAPIQGLASEVGVTTGQLVLLHTYQYHKQFDIPIEAKTFCQYQRAVHDANYWLSTYATVIPAVHINQWCATYGVTAWFKDVFGMEFNIEPEIELDIKACDADGGLGKDGTWDGGDTWDWQPHTLPPIIRAALEKQVKTGVLEESKLDRAFAACMRPWVLKNQRRYLQNNYPLLGVKEDRDAFKRVNANILDAVRAAGFEPEV